MPRSPPSAPRLSRPSRGVERAGLFFSESLLQKLVLHAELGKHLLEPAVLLLHALHFSYHRGVHAAVLRPPFVKSRTRYAVFPLNVSNGHPALSPLQHRHDLRIRKSALLHPNLLVHNTETILFPNPLKNRGDYPQV